MRREGSDHVHCAIFVPSDLCLFDRNEFVRGVDGGTHASDIAAKSCQTSRSIPLEGGGGGFVGRAIGSAPVIQ